MQQGQAALGEPRGPTRWNGLGKHLIVEFWGCDPRLLDDPARLRQGLMEAARRGGLSVIEVCMHAFAPHGVTGVVLLAESHLAIHTWPEHRYAAVDVFTCGGDPWAALEALKARMDATRVEVRELDRGVLGPLESRAAPAVRD